MKFVLFGFRLQIIRYRKKRRIWASHNFDFEKNMSDWTTENAQGRIQSDGNDCGVFSCMYAESMK